jgi:hypothetical protein
VNPNRSLLFRKGNSLNAEASDKRLSVFGKNFLPAV